MSITRKRVSALAALLLGLVVGSAPAAAQGVTTGGIAGTVTDPSGQPVASVQVQVRNAATGFTAGALTRGDGRYTVLNLQPGTYSVTARRIGFTAATREGVNVALSQTTQVNLSLQTQAAELQAVTIEGQAEGALIAPTRTGTSTTISDSTLRRLPTLNRNFTDFVALVPQVATTTGYLSGGGVNLRQNTIQIDGAQASDPFGLGTTGQPGGQANARSVPLDAVQQYQVLLSPFDVRQGNFGGLLINAITRSGTNEFHGSIFGFTRDQDLTREQDYLTDYTQQQYGGSFGGPILRDRLFFFVSGEFQRLRQPAAGPYIGASNQYVAQSSIDQLNDLLSSTYGYTEAGTGAQVQRQNPNQNVFARIDANLPWNTRLVLRHNYADADNAVFSRTIPAASGAAPNFALTSNLYEFSSTTHSTVGELLTNLSSGISNEFRVARTTIKDFRTVPTTFPQITVRGIPRTDNPALTANFVFGTDAPSQGNSLDQETFELTNNLTIPVGAHALTLGTKNTFYDAVNLFAQNRLGNWTFNSLADLQAGRASNYQIAAPAPTDPYNGLANVKANQYAVYVQDVWTATPRLTISAGIRWDRPDFRTLPPFNESVEREYGRRTNVLPEQSQWSPRLGFNWDVTGDQRNQLRGGVGSFAGNVPFVYLSNAFGNSGLSGFASITCNNTAPAANATSSLITPAFTRDAIENPPLSCAPGTRPDGVVVPGATISGPSASANVATIDPNFKLPQYLKATLGYDRRFDNGLVATIEGLYTRAQNNVFYQNLALAGPVNSGTPDRFGRVLYGDLLANGARAATVGARQQVLDVTNHSGDYTWSVTGQLQKPFSDNFEASFAYTYQQARDVVSTTSSTQGSNFRYQRSVSGRLDDRSVTRSKYDQPSRVVATGTYRFQTGTDVSLIYTGNSGAPFDYVYGSPTGSLGDLNADGQTQNDLFYVPNNVYDGNEILFQGYNGTATEQANALAQAQALDAFIDRTPCLRESRGRILERNACRNPWVNQIDISVAQSLGALAGNRFPQLQNLQVRLDVVNFGNLLNENWGRQAYSDQGSTCGQICSATVLVDHRANRLAAGTTPTTPIVSFTPGFQAFNADNASSNYRMQLSARYSF